jgi:hypothetical protein
MKRLCLVCELWLVELFIKGGEVSYWCERCHQNSKLGDLQPQNSWQPQQAAESLGSESTRAVAKTQSDSQAQAKSVA